MIIYKCPSCGADIQPLSSLIYTCEHCGTTFSFDNEKDVRKMVVKIKQIKIALSDSDFDKAEKLCNKAIDIDPENAEVYYLKLLCKHFINTEERLTNYALIPDKRSTWGVSMDDEYKKAYAFGDDAMRKKLESFNLSVIYNGGLDWQNRQEYLKAYNSFKKTSGYKDSDERAEICKKLAENSVNKKQNYSSAPKNAPKISRGIWYLTVPGLCLSALFIIIQFPNIGKGQQSINIIDIIMFFIGSGPIFVICVLPIIIGIILQIIYSVRDKK